VCERIFTIPDHIDYPLFTLASKNRLTGWQNIIFVKKSSFKAPFLYISMGSFTCWIAKAGFRCTQGAFIFGILYGGGEKIGIGGDFWVQLQNFALCFARRFSVKDSKVTGW
jgi:hypothetical protein